MTSSTRLDELQRKFDENPRRYFAPLANEFRKAGQAQRAVEICQRHLPQQPGHMSGHVVLAQALLDLRQLGDAREAFETALDLDPENLVALRSLGDIHAAWGDVPAARQWYQRVLEVDPRNPEIHDAIAALQEAAAQPEHVPRLAPEQAPEQQPAGDLRPPGARDLSTQFPPPPPAPAFQLPMEGAYDAEGERSPAGLTPPARSDDAPAPETVADFEVQREAELFTADFFAEVLGGDDTGRERGDGDDAAIAPAMDAPEGELDHLFGGFTLTGSRQSELDEPRAHDDASPDDGTEGERVPEPIEMPEVVHGSADDLLEPDDAMTDVDPFAEREVEHVWTPASGTEGVQVSGDEFGIGEEFVVGEEFHVDERFAIGAEAVETEEFRVEPPPEPAAAEHASAQAEEERPDVREAPPAEEAPAYLGEEWPSAAERREEEEDLPSILSFAPDDDVLLEQGAERTTGPGDGAIAGGGADEPWQWGEESPRARDAAEEAAPDAAAGPMARSEPELQPDPEFSNAQPEPAFADAEPDPEFADGRPERDAAPHHADPEVPYAQPAPVAFVTETMAELLVRQGFRDQALGVYRQLVEARPDDHSLRARAEALAAGHAAGAGEEDEGTASPLVSTWLARLVSSRLPAPPAESEKRPIVPIEELLAAPVEPGDEQAAGALVAATLSYQEDRRVESELARSTADDPESIERVLHLTPASGAVAVQPSSSFSFEQFFRESRPGGTGEEAPADRPQQQDDDQAGAATPPSPDEAAAADLAEFHAWLAGLSKP